MSAHLDLDGLGLNTTNYKGWPRITEQTHIVRENSLYRQVVKTHIFPGSLAFQWAYVDRRTSNERWDIAGYLKACRHTPTANNCVCVERGKKIFSADKTHENVEADVYSSQCEDRKKSELTPQNTRLLPDSVSLNSWKNGCACGTMRWD